MRLRVTTAEINHGAEPDPVRFPRVARADSLSCSRAYWRRELDRRGQGVLRDSRPWRTASSLQRMSREFRGPANLLATSRGAPGRAPIVPKCILEAEPGIRRRRGERQDPCRG